MCPSVDYCSARFFYLKFACERSWMEPVIIYCVGAYAVRMLCRDPVAAVLLLCGWRCKVADTFDTNSDVAGYSWHSSGDLLWAGREILYKWNSPRSVCMKFSVPDLLYFWCILPATSAAFGPTPRCQRRHPGNFFCCVW